MTLTPPLISTIYWRVLVLNYLKIYSKPLSHALRITNNKAILSGAKLLKNATMPLHLFLSLNSVFLMAFTFLYLSLFSWCFFLFFFLEIPNTFFSRRFQSVLQFPALLTGTAGWSLGGGAEPAHVLLRPVLRRVSILDLLGGFSRGRIAKWGPRGEIVSTMHSFVISAGR